jgi:uncharacterized RDD family membrane protein YckC
MKIHMKCHNCGQENPAEARFCSNCGTILTAIIEPKYPSAPTVPLPVNAIEYSGFWIRLAAAIIDYIIVSAVISIIRMLIFIPMFIGRGWNPLSSPMIASLGMTYFLALLYFWLFTGLKGQTLGKMAVGIKVVDKQGNRPDLGCAALREIVGRLVSTITLFIGFFWIAGDKEKQGWHDKIADTHVIKTR